MTRISRALEFRSVAAAAVAVFIFAPALWMLLDREAPYSIEFGSISPADPRPGGEITVTWRVQELRTCRPSPSQRVVRTIIDSKGVRHDYAPVGAEYGRGSQGRPDITRDVQLPAAIPPGPARYSATACFVCNPLQEFWPVCVQTPELQFTIAPRDPAQAPPQP